MRATLSDKPEIEYLDGAPHAKVSPKRTHALVQGALLRWKFAHHPRICACLRVR